MPALIDELTTLQGSSHKFEYQKLKVITNYFMDGTQLKASANVEEFAGVHLKLNENKETVLKHIKRNAFILKLPKICFETIATSTENFINLKTVKGILFARSWV
jgi:hypothetical protein